MRVLEIARPPLDEQTLRAIAAGNPEDLMTLAIEYGRATQAVRSYNKARGELLHQAWCAAMIAVAGGVACLVAAVFLPAPPK
jgi:hypothetical protein